MRRIIKTYARELIGDKDQNVVDALRVVCFLCLDAISLVDALRADFAISREQRAGDERSAGFRLHYGATDMFEQH